MAERFVQDYETFDLGDVALQHGATLQDAKLAYKTFGELNADKSNAIVYPTWYSGFHWDNEWLIGDGMALDPAKYFIIVPNMLGNGLSTSPSNTPPPYDKARLPERHLLRPGRAASTSWSPSSSGSRRCRSSPAGRWAPGRPTSGPSATPTWCSARVPFCGSSKTSEHNIVFLEGVKAALTGGRRVQGRLVRREAGKVPARGGARVRRLGLLAGLLLGPRLQGMGHSQARLDSFPTLEDFLVAFWEGFFLDRRDANNLLTMLWTWQNGDIGADARVRRRPHQGAAVDQGQAHRRCPAEKDLYFPPEDEEYASQYIPNGEFRVIPGVWGHFAGGGANPVDRKFIDDVLKELLAS